MYKKIIIQNDSRLVLDLPLQLQNKLLEIFVVPVDDIDIGEKLDKKDDEELISNEINR